MKQQGIVSVLSLCAVLCLTGTTLGGGKENQHPRSGPGEHVESGPHGLRPCPRVQDCLVPPDSLRINAPRGNSRGSSVFCLPGKSVHEF